VRIPFSRAIGLVLYAWSSRHLGMNLSSRAVGVHTWRDGDDALPFVAGNPLGFLRRSAKLRDGFLYALAECGMI